MAEVIIKAAQRPIRKMIAGGSGVMLSAARFAPRATDLFMERFTFEGQKTDTLASPHRPHSLYSPVQFDGGERGSNWDGRTVQSSLYTKAMLHPVAAAGIFASVLGFGMWRLGKAVSGH